MTVTIYHNPRCSKSRKTLELIHQNGFTPTIIEYLKSNLTYSEITEIIQALQTNVKAIVRKNEPLYKDLNLGDVADEVLIKAIITHPVLLERPIVLNENKAVIGRPPENVLEIL